VVLAAVLLLPGSGKQALAAACSPASLISSINQANSNPDLTEIFPPAGCVYTFTAADNLVDGPNALPDITTPVVIEGAGAIIERSSAEGVPPFRLFHVSSTGSLTLRDVWLRNGLTLGGDGGPGGGGGGAGLGGAVFNNGGTLTLERSTSAATLRGAGTAADPS
jgi:hypothetical protein